MNDTNREALPQAYMCKISAFHCLGDLTKSMIRILGQTHTQLECYVLYKAGGLAKQKDMVLLNSSVQYQWGQRV